MIFKLHYWLVAAGSNAIGILMGVFIEEYTDASSLEIGALFMMMPFVGIVFRPLMAAVADREQAHRKYMILFLLAEILSHLPFVIIPCLGPGVYKTYARYCWYTLASLKILGDIAFEGMKSIADSVVINYASRIGTEFNTYRVWGTVSWFCFGLVISRVNEVHFLPKYVPGFLILIGCSLLDTFLIWVWPEEYFEMRPAELKPSGCQSEQQSTDKKLSFYEAMMRSLLPREVIWERIKPKLVWLITLGLVDNRSRAPTTNQASEPQQTAAQQLKRPQNEPDQGMSKMTQLQILVQLMSNDPRIILYLIYFMIAGATVAPLSFWFMSLKKICETDNTCNFSELAGYLQVSMAAVETVLFIYIKRIISCIGRVNAMAASLCLMTGKFLFYATIWTRVDPHWSLLAEQLYGLSYVINLTLMVEMGHHFANEVEFILPQLIAKGTIKKEEATERVRMSLQATMQALISSVNDGFGRGFFAFVCGVLLKHYFDYIGLWLVIGLATLVSGLVVIAINSADFIFDFGLGLDVHAERQAKQMKQDFELGAPKIADKKAAPANENDLD